MSKADGKYKAKNYYKKQNASRKTTIDVNMRGFFCSSSNREKDCIKEAYNLLNEYADKLYPTPSSAEPESEDISENLGKELEALKNDRKSDQRRFQLVDSGAKNFLFIKTTLKDPVELAEYIIKDIEENKIQKTKFLLRLVPVEKICKAHTDDILKAFEQIGEKHFKDSGQTFCVMFNHRNNNDVSRDEVIKRIAEKVNQMNPDNKVDLKEGKITIVVEVIKGFGFVSVIPDYLKYKKYNLLSICN